MCGIPGLPGPCAEGLSRGVPGGFSPGGPHGALHGGGEGHGLQLSLSLSRAVGNAPSWHRSSASDTGQQPARPPKPPEPRPRVSRAPSAPGAPNPLVRPRRVLCPTLNGAVLTWAGESGPEGSSGGFAQTQLGISNHQPTRVCWGCTQRLLCGAEPAGG